MQLAIYGTYERGKVVLNELPPTDEPSDVMVVFLPKIKNPHPKLKTAQLFGIAKNDDDNDINEYLSQLSKNSEQHILDRWDRLNNE